MLRRTIALAFALLATAVLVAAQSRFSAETPATCAAKNLPANRYDTASLNCVDCNAGGFQFRVADGSMQHSTAAPLVPLPAAQTNPTPLIATLIAGGCKCSSGYRKDLSSTDPSSFAFTCSDCSTLTPGTPAAFRDGSSCVACSASTTGYDATRRDCACAAGSVLVEKDSAGKYLTATGKVCVPCPTGTQIIGTDYYTCQACPDALMTMTIGGSGAAVCTCPTLTHTIDFSGQYCFPKAYITSLDLLAPISGAASITYRDVYRSDTSSVYSVTVSASYTMNQYYTAAAIRCQQYKIRSACHTLANLCVLQIYDPTSKACSLFKSIADSISAQSNSFSDWKESLPILKYSSDAVLNSKLLQSTLSLHSGDDSGTRSTIQNLQFKILAYTMNGTLVGVQTLTDQLQLCSSDASTSPTAFTLSQVTNYLRFGTSFSNTCSIRLDTLLTISSAAGPLFYDMYYIDEGPMWFPVPVKVLNVRDAQGNRLNRNNGGEIMSTGNLQLNSRFYLTDVVSGLTSASATSPQVVSYAQSITLRITVQEEKETLYPPVLVISYQQREWTDIAAGSATTVAKFDVVYTISQSGVLTAETVMFALAVVLWFAMWVFQCVQEQRTNKIDVMGPGYCFRVLMNGFALMADFLFWLAVIFTFYYFIFFKGQAASFILLPLPGGSEENMLVAVIVTSFVGKIWRIFYLLFKQITLDVFFVDHEQSRGTAVTVESGAGQQNPENAQRLQPSTWRRILVAKKFTELAITRGQSITFTFLLLIFLLRGMGLEYMATSQPQLSDLSPDAAPINKILRFAVSTFWLLFIAGLQITIRRFVLHRYWKNPLMDFVDLCSVTNISVFMVDQKYHSWFIHGKTVHAFTEVSLPQLRDNLQRERSGNIRPRGLFGDGKDTFEFYVNGHWNTRFTNLNRSMQVELESRERASRGVADRRDQQAAASGGAAGGGPRTSAGGSVEMSIMAEQGLHDASARMNQFLMEFIDNTYTGHVANDRDLFRWERGVRSYWNKRFGVAPDIGDGSRNWLFDDDGMSFRDTFLMGVEYELLLFTVLFYAIMDLWFSNTLASVFVTWCVNWLIARMRSHFGQTNISRKTLIDDVFLV